MIPNGSDAVVYPACVWRCWPPGQDGHSRTAGQSWCRPRGPGLLSAWCGVGSTDGPSVASLAQHLLAYSRSPLRTPSLRRRRPLS